MFLEQPFIKIVIIAKRCLENITLVVKCVKMPFPKVLSNLKRKKKMLDFYGHCCHYFFSQYFLEDHLDTFDNRCDVLEAAFCDSPNVFVEILSVFCVKRLLDFLCEEVA